MVSGGGGCVDKNNHRPQSQQNEAKTAHFAVIGEEP